MSIKLASLNTRDLRDRGKAIGRLRDLGLVGVSAAAIPETHFLCNVDARVLSSDFVYSVYEDKRSGGVSLLVKSSLNARGDFFHVNVLGGEVDRG